MGEGHRPRAWRRASSGGTNRERLQNIRSLMETTGWPAEQVMTAMKIPAADQPKYLKLLSLPPNRQMGFLHSAQTGKHDILN